MEPDRWQHLRKLLFEALELPAEARDNYLENACGDDEALLEEVRSLLAEDPGRHRLFEEAEDGRLRFLASIHAAHGADQQIGPYRVLAEIGHGGMGVVYLAEREDVQKRVALKLVRDGLASPEHLQRFLFERRVLARLEHPHIAQFLDAGVTEKGTPYVALEYVEGLPLTDYCDRRRLGIEARLRLFQHVGEAVQHAHRNLVVHRDLKPSNILVTEDGQVKLLDFGIAKLLEDEEQEPTLTRPGARVMTPAYASPEQIRGDPVTTATDVYSLGVVLYELLTGRRPYEGEGHAADAARAVLETPPEKPSTAVTQVRDLAATGAARATTPDRLQRRLRGDLDTICLKALRKEPERRYTSAEAFLEDIRRHLAGLPVVARPDTMGYRARKFVQRHRWPVGGTLLVAVLVVGFAWMMAMQAERLSRALVQTEHERQKADQVAAFLVRIFETADPRTAGQRKAFDIVREAAAQIQKELADQPEQRATLMLHLGRVHQNLGEYDLAFELLNASLDLRRHHLGNDHLDVAEGLFYLAELRQLAAVAVDGEAVAREALQIYQQRLGQEHSSTAAAMNLLGTTLMNSNKTEEAAVYLYESLAIHRRLPEAQELDIASSLHNLGGFEYERGQLQKAEQLLREAFNIRQAHTDSVGMLNSAQMLGSTLTELERFEEAETYLREALALQRLLYPHFTSARLQDRLATLLQGQQRYDEAEALFRDALAVQRRVHGDTSWASALALNNLALLLQLKEDYDEAEPYARQARAVYAIMAGEGHPYTAIAQSNLGWLLYHKGEYEQAAELLEASYRILERERGLDFNRTQSVVERLVSVYEAWNRPEQAHQYAALLK